MISGMKQFKQLMILLLFLWSEGLLKAQESKPTAFSLQQAIDYAKKNSPLVLSASLDEKNAEHRKKEVAGMGFPQITGSIDAKNYLKIPVVALPARFMDPT